MGGLGEAFGLGRGRNERIPALIVVVAVVLVTAALLDLVRDGGGAATSEVFAEPVSEGRAGAASAVPLHTLLPDVTDAIGREVRVEGTVAAVSTGEGFWVRDLRGNAVFVVAETDGLERADARGDAVRVTGRIELMPSETAARRGAETMQGGPNGGGQVVRSIELVPVGEGVARLEP